jgi:hypothetical protein
MRDLKNALQELTATLKALPPASVAPKAFVPDVTHNPEQAKAEVAPPKSEPTSAPAADTTAPLTSPAPETTSTPATTAGIDYAQVAKAITDTFKVDRAKTIAALAKFGAAKGPQLKPEDYAAFLKELAA